MACDPRVRCGSVRFYSQKVHVASIRLVVGSFSADVVTTRTPAIDWRLKDSSPEILDCREHCSRTDPTIVDPLDMNLSYEELAGMIDHSLLHPTMTDAELEAGCKVAAEYQVASVCIKPYFVRQAVELLKGTGVKVGCVIGFPHGNSLTEVKRYETELACRDGAVEIDMVINVGKALGGDWAFVEQDVKAVCNEAHHHGAKVKVIFENDYLTQGGAGLTSDDLKKKLCEICERAGADWVKTSTGYGFVKQPDGSYNYRGATEHDLALMRAACSDRVQVKAAGGVRDLDGLIRVKELGGTRCGASATKAMLEECRKRAASGTLKIGGGKIGSGGY